MDFSDMMEDQIITISLTNKVKEKIVNQFQSELEQFIEINFPQDNDLDIYFFKYKMGENYKLALKVKNSDYMLLVERSIDKYRVNIKDRYLVCFDIQKRSEIEEDENNDFIRKQCELKIPINFDRKFYNNSTEYLLDYIEEKFKDIEPYRIPSLSGNDEFKKWYAYLTLLEKLIDTKDFYFEAKIVYSEKKAKVDISHIKDKELLEKIKRARGQFFFYYKEDEVDLTKELHEWDEQDNRNRGFGELKGNQDNKLSFNLDDDFIGKFTTKRDENEIISQNYDTNDFIANSRQFIEDSIKKINHNIKYKNENRGELNVKHSIESLNISQNEKTELKNIWSKLSQRLHNKKADNVNKTDVNSGLKILDNLLPNQNSENFTPPSKLILRVSYFRDQFQLKTLKNGLERIQFHPLRPYLFGNKKIDKVDDEKVNGFEVEYLSQVLNDRQKEAIKKSLLSKDLFMIQGPPGTGKTEVISEIAYQEAIRGKKVLITSQANMAVDNAIQRLNHPSLYPLRIIRKDYEPEDGDSLPIQANIGTFYQDRIIKNIKNTLDDETSEFKSIKSFLERNIIDEKLIQIASQLNIQISINSDSLNKKEIVEFLNKAENKQILELRLNELEQLKSFHNIQKNFLSDLENQENFDIEEERSYLSSNYIKNTNIWGATLFETGKYSFKDTRFDVVIVDEVSKATPPELVLPILKANKLILVGDHKQLPPIIKNDTLEDLSIETGISVDSLDLETTVFEKLIENNPDSYVMLNTQYRMHPHIQMAINQFYRTNKDEKGLECGLLNPDIEKCHKIQHEIYKNKHLVWLKTKNSDIEQKLHGESSFFNTSEVNKIKTTLKILNNEYKKKKQRPSVGVITFYGKQLGKLTTLEKRGYWNLPYEQRNFPNLNLRFGTVDRFQGQEKDIIIVSLVRNNDAHNVGFAKKPHRINVAFSRARNLLIIVGNADNFTFGQDENSSKQYREIFNIAKKFGTVKGI